MRIRIFSISWALVMIVVIPSFGKCSPKIPSTLPVTSTFFSFDAANAATDIQSDGLDGGSPGTGREPGTDGTFPICLTPAATPWAYNTLTFFMTM